MIETIIDFLRGPSCFFPSPPLVLKRRGKAREEEVREGFRAAGVEVPP